MIRYNFNCEGGKHDNFFDDRNNPPSECNRCFEEFVWSNVFEVEDNSNNEITGLILTYQKNQQKIEIPFSTKIILGREHVGSELLSNIFFNGKVVISRKHCSIVHKDGGLYVCDEGSCNGTFYGINKINCKNNPVKIEDNSIMFLGQEPFIVNINYKEEVQLDSVLQLPIEDNKVVKFYKCRSCGNNFNEKTDVCPICNNYKTID